MCEETGYPSTVDLVHDDDDGVVSLHVSRPLTKLQDTLTYQRTVAGHCIATLIHWVYNHSQSSSFYTSTHSLCICFNHQ
ncbi:unnamed protein product [Allacma fusca]|uniref:Uncharacterized protein n=1 Tax=Allacma fusca TaxID=39272 RepID=A0A8J2JZX4_9HEXA|nr:unnamed protein product [Allacma fusca]